MKEIEFSRWLFEGRLWQGKNVLPDGLNWLCYFFENSISCIFLESPHQVDMKNVVKFYKHFFWYFNALKTHCGIQQILHKSKLVFNNPVNSFQRKSLWWQRLILFATEMVFSQQAVSDTHWKNIARAKKTFRFYYILWDLPKSCKEYSSTFQVWHFSEPFSILRKF